MLHKDFSFIATYYFKSDANFSRGNISVLPLSQNKIDVSFVKYKGNFTLILRQRGYIFCNEKHC